MFALLLAASVLGSATVPAAGMVITRSTTIKPGAYFLSSASLDQPALVIRGDNLVVDFASSTLMGSDVMADPDQRKGLGLLVEGRNIEIRNLSVRGYRVGLRAQNTVGLKITDSEFSDNYRPRLSSDQVAENLSDWMFYHRNDKDEWMQFGSGIYLYDSHDFEIKNVKANRGLNGLMMNRSTGGLIWNSDFSFHSAVGIAMYRSSRNRIMHNRIDFCVRGYSHGVYNRGQDSAGILAFEQCNENVIAYNSVTHGGDGWFLWAGHSTMDTGEGGSNDNLLFGNDFSHSPTNGIEATFSRNNFINNLLIENWHGIWGGYSFDSLVLGNVFGLNGDGIAWEHGQGNRVLYNRFHGDWNALAIWANASEPDWPYARLRDTRSRDWLIEGNVFEDVHNCVLLTARTGPVDFRNNRIISANTVFALRGDAKPEDVQIRATGNAVPAGAEIANWATWTSGREGVARDVRASAHMNARGEVMIDGVWDPVRYRTRFMPFRWSPFLFGYNQHDRAVQEMARYAPKPLDGGMNPFTDRGRYWGRRFLLIDEWGPVDFKFPVLWKRQIMGMRTTPAYQAQLDAKSTTTFQVVGPEGKWRVLRTKGVKSISPESGTVPQLVEIQFDPAEADREVVFEFVGEEAWDHKGLYYLEGKPIEFVYSEFELETEWEVSFWQWDRKTQDPRQNREQFRELLQTPPLHQLQSRKIDFNWGSRAPHTTLLPDYFATVAEGVVRNFEGEAELEVVADDGVRVYVDGKIVIDEWQYQGPTRFTAQVQLHPGSRIRVEHFEIDGNATLRLRITPWRKPGR